MNYQEQQEAPPAWAQAMMQQIEEGQRAQQQRTAAQDERIRQLENILARQTANSPTLGSVTETTTEPTPNPAESISTTARRLRPRLPDPPFFAGNVNDWGTWRITIENKLAVDGAAIGSRQDQFMYIFSRLEKLAWKNTGTYVKHSRDTAGPDDLLAYLEGIYGDPNAQSRAARRLYQIKQTNRQPFTRFLPKLEKEFADAGAINWPDEARRQILLGALNEEMSVALMNRGIPATYSGLISRLHEITTDMDALNLGKSRSNKSPRRQQRNLDEMDWSPTIDVNRINPRGNRPRKGVEKQAKWSVPIDLPSAQVALLPVKQRRTERFTILWRNVAE
ncbi:retrotransposon gag protein [Penicillium diatomitis]|uniref:Retrotransposon gag protein n=1 Tax=Penicillium diatomitis TaxID=2819901 RepID=A0A9W9WQM3_9EURO|nr:retrotransposon gag protein [Penicillium diatomitis]XP_056786456.1 retrotransposon gag protein [Penicillium diatomitis]KAJ5471895.1 retrotransposon gag protein [Penicillium diatomitis]KAJ5471910.1 retrotransposon gag protein [Penicillium diatomitis]